MNIEAEKSGLDVSYPALYKAVNDDFTVEFESDTVGVVTVQGSSSKVVGTRLGGLGVCYDKANWVKVSDGKK